MAFNILDESTWNLASQDKPFVWKDTTFSNEETGRDVTESEFVAFVGQAINAIRQSSSDEKIRKAGLSNVIALIVDLLNVGLSATNALLITNTGLENGVDFSWYLFEAARQEEENKRKKFEMDDVDSWRFATEGSLIWEGKAFYILPQKNISEVIFVKIMRSLFFNILMDFHQRPNLLIITTTILFDSLKHDKKIPDIMNQIGEQIRKSNNTDNSAKEAGANKPEKLFAVLDESTWSTASDNAFYWNDKTIPNQENKADFSEKGIVNILSNAMSTIGGIYSKSHIDRYGRAEIIVEFLDEFAKGYIPTEVILGKVTGKIQYEHRLFDILDIKSWDFASKKLFLWNGNKMYGPDKNLLTERDIVDLFHGIFNFLERKGELIPIEEKRKSIKTLLERMAKSHSDPSWVDKEKERLTRHKSIFDPRNPRTYRNAGQNQLIIDGLPIYRYGSGENWTITRKPVTETDFANWIRTNVKNQHFQTPEDRQKYYHDYIQWYYDNNDMSENVYGGLKFTDGMIELVSHLPVENWIKIGELFSELLKSDPRPYRFQQELFGKGMRVESHSFPKIALAASFQVEQECMIGYYHGFEFDNKDEIYDFFDSSKYLNKYPRLKEKVIKTALDFLKYLEEDKEE